MLSKFSRGMAGASTDDSLLQMARLVVEATGAEQVTVWLRLGDLLQPQARWPPTGQPPDPIALDGYSLEKALVEMQPGSQSFPVARGGAAGRADRNYLAARAAHPSQREVDRRPGGPDRTRPSLPAHEGACLVR